MLADLMQDIRNSTPTQWVAAAAYLGLAALAILALSSANDQAVLDASSCLSNADQHVTSCIERTTESYTVRPSR